MAARWSWPDDCHGSLECRHRQINVRLWQDGELVKGHTRWWGLQQHELVLLEARAEIYSHGETADPERELKLENNGYNNR
jgi:hypothetical protein